MGKFVDLAGQKFGKLTVIEFSHIGKDRGAYWKCLCACGNEKIAASRTLKRGGTKTCGCGYVECLAGSVFGNLEVLEFSHIGKHRHAYWKCKCVCGNDTVAAARHLKSGNIQSCGCLHKLDYGAAAFNALYRSYKYAARGRNYSFELTTDEFAKLTQQQCHYCGKLPSNIYYIKKLNGKYVYNGIDRMDNTKGYTVENCVPCCGVCNRAKDIMGYAEFRDWISTTYKHFVGEAQYEAIR